MTDKPQTTLLPCPFCGSTCNDADDVSSAGPVVLGKKYNKSGRSSIVCGTCGVCMHEWLFSSQKMLVKRWNTRHDE